MLWLAAVGSCGTEVDTSAPPTGDGGSGLASTTGGSSTSSASGGGGGEVCLWPDDAECDDEADCACIGCLGAASCTPFGCEADGLCTPGSGDSCTCSECDWSPACITLGSPLCVADGVCDSESEGCGCPDCYTVATCSDNVGLCAGGQPNGACEPTAESCSCSDCIANEGCFCAAEAWHAAPCICPACWQDPYCAISCGSISCQDDQLCDWHAEGCHCADCAAVPLCAGFTG